MSLSALCPHRAITTLHSFKASYSKSPHDSHHTIIHIPNATSPYGSAAAIEVWKLYQEVSLHVMLALYQTTHACRIYSWNPFRSQSSGRVQRLKRNRTCFAATAGQLPAPGLSRQAIWDSRQECHCLQMPWYPAQVWVTPHRQVLQSSTTSTHWILLCVLL